MDSLILNLFQASNPEVNQLDQLEDQDQKSSTKSLSATDLIKIVLQHGIFLSKHQRTSHNNILQKYTSVYLGDEWSPKLNKVLQQINNQQQKIHINSINDRQERFCQEYLQQKNRKIRNTLSNSHVISREQLIEKIKSSSFVKLNEETIYTDIEQILDYDKMLEEQIIQTEKKNELLAERMRKIQSNRVVGSAAIKKVNKSVGTYIQALLKDIETYRFQKSKLKIEYYKTENINLITQVESINEKSLKPLLQDLLCKILESPSKQYLKQNNLNIELQFFKSMNINDKIEGLEKKNLMKIFTESLRQLKLEQRQCRLIPKTE